MSNFKMIGKLGLLVWDQDGATGWVKAEELEQILQSAQVVYGCPDSDILWGTTREQRDTHSALLLGIQPLKKKTKAEAALELLERLHSMSGIFNVAWPKDDMKRILQMKDEV